MSGKDGNNNCTNLITNSCCYDRSGVVKAAGITVTATANAAVNAVTANDSANTSLVARALLQYGPIARSISNFGATTAATKCAMLQQQIQSTVAQLAMKIALVALATSIVKPAL